MKTVSDREYKKYEAWKTKDKVRKSLFETYNLEEDIDFPIRNSVAILALAGATPLFSCCGFDYHGQPEHKAHQYGEPYIMLGNDAQTIQVIGSLFGRLAFGWKFSKEGGVTFLQLTRISNPHWDNKELIHFSEEIVIAINSLEATLFGELSYRFLEEVILEDTNKNHNKNLKYWQYPPKNPWVITLESLTV